MILCSWEQVRLCTFLSNTFLCLHFRNGEDQVAQMESRNADRGLWKWKLKITEQLKENKQGFIRNNCLKSEKKHFQLKMKEDARTQKQVRWGSLQRKLREGRKNTILQKMGQETEVQYKLGHHSMEWDHDFVETTRKSGLTPRITLTPRTSLGEHTRKPDPHFHLWLAINIFPSLSFLILYFLLSCYLSSCFLVLNSI